MKKILVSLIAGALAISLVACSFTKTPAGAPSEAAASAEDVTAKKAPAASSAPSASPKKSAYKKGTPEFALESGLNAFRDADAKGIAKYFNDQDDDVANKTGLASGIAKALEKEDTMSEEDRETVLMMTKNLTYKIGKSVVNGKTAVISTDITNIDMSEVFTDVIAAALSQSLVNPNLSEKELEEAMLKKFAEIIDGLENKKVTKTVDVNLVKVGDDWKINVDASLLDALLGGLVGPALSMIEGLEGLDFENMSLEGLLGE